MECFAALVDALVYTRSRNGKLALVAQYLRKTADPDRCVLVGAYALGKAQRVIAELRLAGYVGPIWLHGALERMCRL